MKHLFIPELGTNLELNENWSFDLYAEYRNENFGKYNGQSLNRSSYKSNFDFWIESKSSSIPIVLPKGTILTIDRIYIRK